MNEEVKNILTKIGWPEDLISAFENDNRVSYPETPRQADPPPAEEKYVVSHEVTFMVT